jgi:hypothetical protein
VNDRPTFNEYLATLGRLTAHVDPTAASGQAAVIKAGAQSLANLPGIDVNIMASWVGDNPTQVPVLGLTVGLSQERLKNVLRHHFDTSGWVTLARERSLELVQMLDQDFDLLRLLRVQRGQAYDFGDVLVARAGTRGTATRAGVSGRRVEDEIEAIATDLGLPSAMRSRFTGRNGRTAPCDLAIPDAATAEIVVAAKGFDSTGSKLTDAVREIEEMAEVRLARQSVFAVIDGIGWMSRKADLRRIYDLWTSNSIDGMYTLATLGDLRRDIEKTARLRGLL